MMLQRQMQSAASSRRAASALPHQARSRGSGVLQSQASQPRATRLRRHAQALAQDLGDNSEAEASVAAAAAEEPRSSSAPAPATSTSAVPASSVWELDFCSRPLLDERGKKVWELLVTDPDRTFEHAQYFPNSKINSVEVRAASSSRRRACGGGMRISRAFFARSNKQHAP